jgi:hypothetical protein
MMTTVCSFLGHSKEIIDSLGEDTQGPVTIAIVVSDICRHCGVQGDYRARNVLTIEVAVEERCLLSSDKDTRYLVN